MAEISEQLPQPSDMTIAQLVVRAQLIIEEMNKVSDLILAAARQEAVNE